MSLSVFRRLLATSVISSTFASMPALAQDGAVATDASDQSKISDERVIIVTAQRRQEDLIDVPVAITAFDADELDMRGVTDFTQIAMSVPNMQIEEVQSQRNQRIIIRGISSDTRFAGAESAVGVNVDGVSLAGVSGLSYDLADIERIEVLRGPQGTLYGRNTAAGVVNIFTTKPGNQFEAAVTGEYGNFDHKLVKGYVRGPIIEDKLFAGVTAIKAKRDGFETLAATGEDVNTRNTFGIRGQLLWTPAPDWEIRLIAEYQDDDFSQQRGQDDALEPIDRELTSVPFRPEAKRELHGYSLTIEKTFDSLSVRSISSHRSYETREIDSNLAVAGESFLDRLTAEKSKEFTQELQISSLGKGPIKWVAGAYLLDQDLTSVGQYDLDIDGIYSVLFGPTAAFFFGAPGNLASDSAYFGGPACPLEAPACVGIVPAEVTWAFDTQSYAVFGQVEIDIDRVFSLDFGGRYSHEKKDFLYDSFINAAIPPLPGFLPDGVVFIAGQGNPDFGAPLPYTDSIKNDRWNMRIALNAAINDNNNLYVSAAQGSKSGSFFANVLGISDGNGNGVNDNVEFLKVLPEKSWNYEIGAKGRLGVLTYAAAFYYIDYKGLQTQRVIPLATTDVQILGNADAKSYGSEIEANVQLSQSLAVEMSFGYNNATFKSYPDCAPATNCRGNNLVYAPRFTGSISMNYNHPISSNLDVFARIEAKFRDKQDYDVTNEQSFRSDDVMLLDSTIGLKSSSNNWTIAFWGRNLANETYRTFITPDLVGRNVTLGTPRTYGLRVSFAY